MSGLAEFFKNIQIHAVYHYTRKKEGEYTKHLKFPKASHVGKNGIQGREVRREKSGFLGLDEDRILRSGKRIKSAG